MYTLTMNLASSEWIKVKQAALRQWPDEKMSSGELCRRYVLAGVEALENITEEDRARLAQEYRATMYAPDGRLKT